MHLGAYTHDISNCHFIKVQNQVKNRKYQEFEKYKAAFSIYYPYKLVHRFSYQLADKYGPQKHLGAYTPINATMSKSPKLD